MPITSRDDELLKALALKVRVLSLSQIAAAWWAPTPAGRSNARRRLAVFIRAGLLLSAHFQVRPLPSLTAPVATWRPDTPPPNFGSVAWKLQSRWTSPPRRTTVYFVSGKGANQYGGRARGAIKREFQVTHDLGVAQLYLNLLRTDPDAAAQWVGEDVLRYSRRREKIPDAVLMAPNQRTPRLVIEFGGAYDVRRLRKFHRDCACRGLPYEIW